MSNYQDFGFSGEEYQGELTTVPYCQFLNASTNNYGIAITPHNAELAQFELIDTWQPIEHEFSDGTTETLLVTNKPKILVLNRSKPMMSNDKETIPYSKQLCQSGNYKAFSYVVVWFLDRNNKPISELPVRLKCSGYSGLTFLKNYSYYNNANSFCKKFLQTYKNLTGDRAIDKNEIFYAHGVYQPNLTRRKATSSVNGQSSFAVMTDSFVEPTKDNFASLIIKNGSVVSNKIKEFIKTTEPWLKTESVEPGNDDIDGEGRWGNPSLSNRHVEVDQTIEPNQQNGIEAALTPDPIPF